MRKSTFNRLIAEMTRVKRELDLLDHDDVYNCGPPPAGATEEDLSMAERAIGEPLDASYRAFLSLASGWPGITVANDLFGASDLCGSKLFEDAKTRVGWLAESEVLHDLGLEPSQLLPIAAARHEIDVYVMMRRATREHGMVIWFRGYEIERYQGFAEYFEAQIGYNHAAIQRELSNGRDA